MLQQYHVIIERNGTFVPWDVIPLLISEFKNVPKSRKPKTLKEFKDWVDLTSKSHFWGQSQYEFIAVDWPSQKHSEKLDVYQQIAMNIDIVVEILIQTLKLRYE